MSDDNKEPFIDVPLNRTSGVTQPGNYRVPARLAGLMKAADMINSELAAELSAIELQQISKERPRPHSESAYGIRGDTIDKIERLMKQRLKDAGTRRTTRQQAYGQVGIDYATVKKHVPDIHKKWGDWESGWEQDWKQLVGWDELIRDAN